MIFAIQANPSTTSALVWLHQSLIVKVSDVYCLCPKSWDREIVETTFEW